MALEHAWRATTAHQQGSGSVEHKVRCGTLRSASLRVAMPEELMSAWLAEIVRCLLELHLLHVRAACPVDHD
jgi:hypothetical protein